ncbi:MAG: YbhB/YbcL family Raf kinase inhibitor-like protein [Candidatus Omnitrophota bacterium]|nr:YbhB/YbcL family Raf kinase inhibitor-like protein [Candidatus Omnitrophota bacterium]
MNRRIKVLAALTIFLGLLSVQELKGESSMKLTSPEFEYNKSIPEKFTCEGDDINPALMIENIPAAAKSLALIMDDPDATKGMWVHWVVYDIPLLPRIEEQSVPGKEGLNDFGRKRYGGPCPFSGTHRYFFKLYALDVMLDSKEGLTKQALEKAIEGHILEKAELIGLYKKRK